jgi:predicted amidophosphoribosyltransferase
MVRKISGDKTKPEIQIELYKLVEEMRQKAEVSTGECAVCHKEAKLFSGVCEVCFIPWAAEAARSQIRWREK